MILILIGLAAVAAALVGGYLFHKNNPKKDAQIDKAVTKAITTASAAVKSL